jgi:hypothetical protein
MTARIQHKRGDTFGQQCTLRGDDGDPVDLTGIAVRSQVRGVRGQILSELAITPAGPGTFQVRAESSQTSNWPLGLATWDVEFTQIGTVYSSATVLLDIVEDVTR